MSKHLLLPESPLVVLPSLAVLLGLNEAIAVQQIHWICEIKTEHEDYRTFHDGEMWCCYSINQWLLKMPWLGERTCRRMLKGLEERKILIATKPNAREWNHTKWYRIDYDLLDKIGKSNDQNCQIDADKMTGSNRTNLPDLDADKMAGSSIYKKDLKKEKKEEKESVTTTEKDVVVRTAKRSTDLGSLRGRKTDYKAIASENISLFKSPEEKTDFSQWAVAELQKDYKEAIALDKVSWAVRNLDASKDDLLATQLLSRYRASKSRTSHQAQNNGFLEELAVLAKSNPSEAQKRANEIEHSKGLPVNFYWNRILGLL